MRVDRRALGWGVFLVIAGAIPLAVRAGILDQDMLVGWPSLWPLLLIGAGLGMVFRRTPLHLLGGTILVLTSGIMAGSLITAGVHGFPAVGACGSSGGGAAFEERGGSVSDGASMSVELNCGQLDVTAADGHDWALTGRGPSGRPPIVDVRADRIAIAPPDGSSFEFGDMNSTWNVTIPRDPRLALSVTLNAGESNLDLRGARLDSMNLTLNAGALTGDLSGADVAGTINATVNAGSMALSLPNELEGATMTVNAGSAKACVASDAALRISWDGNLAGNNFDDLGLARIDDNHWTVAGASSASNVIDLRISANAGSFELVIGGTCHA